MRTRVVAALLAVALSVAGCGSSAAPVSVSVTPVEPWPAGATEVTTAPATGVTTAPAAGDADCGDRAILYKAANTSLTMRCNGRLHPRSCSVVFGLLGR